MPDPPMPPSGSVPEWHESDESAPGSDGASVPEWPGREPHAKASRPVGGGSPPQRSEDESPGTGVSGAEWPEPEREADRFAAGVTGDSLPQWPEWPESEPDLDASAPDMSGGSLSPWPEPEPVNDEFELGLPGESVPDLGASAIEDADHAWGPGSTEVPSRQRWLRRQHRAVRHRSAELRSWPAGRIAIGFVATIAIVAVDGWRVAALASLASGALAVTRVRFATHVAVGLLTIVAMLVITGHSVSHDHRESRIRPAVLHHRHTRTRDGRHHPRRVNRPRKHSSRAQSPSR